MPYTLRKQKTRGYKVCKKVLHHFPNTLTFPFSFTVAITWSALTQRIYENANFEWQEVVVDGHAI